MDKTLELLKKYTTKPNLLRHATAVSACMRHFAEVEGEDVNYWEVVGLLHDIDYELYPEEHCHKCVQILKDEGFDDKFILTVQSHGYEICTDVEPKLYMEKVLSAVDQLSGFIIACAMMKPEKKLSVVDLDNIKKKWKDKKFAAGTDRDRIMRFCERMGKDFDYVATHTLVALQGIADKLGL